MGDHIAVVGTNRKLLVFPLEQLPEMNRGRGVILQKYKDGGVADAVAFKLSEGLSFMARGEAKKMADVKPWLGKRAQTGVLPPNGFPKNNKFS